MVRYSSAEPQGARGHDTDFGRRSGASAPEAAAEFSLAEAMEAAMRVLELIHEGPGRGLARLATERHKRSLAWCERSQPSAQ
jgi:hypothetical protein